MALPQVLLVDDSEAVLDSERAALGQRCSCVLARNGLEALRRMEVELPDAVVMDLSMPVLAGDAALERMQADSRLRQVPVVVVSSEAERARRCLDRGAVAFLQKPFGGEALLEAVLTAVEGAREKAAGWGARVLPLEVGELRLALDLDDVRSVISQPRSDLLPATQGPPARYVDLHGRPLLLVDLAATLGVHYRHRAADRMVVVIGRGGRVLGASVDAVDNPEEVAREDVTWRAALPAVASQPPEWLTALVRTARGPIPVLDAGALLRGDNMSDAAAALAALRAGTETG